MMGLVFTTPHRSCERKNLRTNVKSNKITLQLVIGDVATGTPSVLYEVHVIHRTMIASFVVKYPLLIIEFAIPCPELLFTAP